MKIKRVPNTEVWTLALDKLDKEAFPTIPVYPKIGAHWWVLGGDYLQGFAGLRIWNATSAFLCRAYVRPEFKGLGYHKRFIRVREKAARAWGLQTLATYTHPANLASANNLISCGFKLYTPHSPFGVEGALYFKKDLT